MQRRQFITGLAGILAASQSPMVLSSSATFTIGQSLPLSGSNAEFGLDVREGVTSFITQHAKSGGAPRFVHECLDDGNKADKAAENTKLLLQNGANVLFGYGSATLSLPSIALAEAAKTPFYAPFTGARSIQKSSSPWVFTARASYDAEVQRFAVALKQFKAQKVVIVHYGDPVGLENKAACMETLSAAGLNAVGVAIKRNAEVGIEIAAAITESQADVVLFTTLAAPSAKIFQDIKADEKSKVSYCVALSFAGPSQFQALLGDKSRGIVVSHVVPPPWKFEFDIVREYQSAMKQAGSTRQATFAGLEAFVALKGLEKALTKAKNSRGESLVAALSSTAGNFGGYPLDFTKNRHGGSYVDYIVITGKKSVA